MVAETADWDETEAVQDVEMEGANHHPMDDFENDVMVDAYNDLKFISRIDMIVPGTWDQDRGFGRYRTRRRPNHRDGILENRD